MLLALTYGTAEDTAVGYVAVIEIKLECGPMPSLMATLPNIGDALC